MLLQGCSAIGLFFPDEPASVDLGATAPVETVYAAPTLPPEYTLTPTATRTRTPVPSPTPFQIASVDPTKAPEGATAPAPTPVLFLGPWERYESSRLGAAIYVPPELTTIDYGSSIRVGDPDIYTSQVPLFFEIYFDQANSYRLPENIDATNPRNVLEAIIQELEQDFAEIQLVRPIRDVYFNGINAAEVAARATADSDNPASIVNWYLAVAIREETVVRFYGSAPAGAGVTYISIAERIADSFTFIE
jgi:hypothetical protein